MRIILAAVGTLRSGPYFELTEDYADRLRRTGPQIGLSRFDIVEVEAPRALDGAARKARENALLASAVKSAVKDAGVVVALDETGEHLSSKALAGRIAGWRDEGTRTLAFLIGGADGLSRDVVGAARLRLSFGRLTWPHMLARTMLCEQLYRTATILSGHPYHRS